MDRAEGCKVVRVMFAELIANKFAYLMFLGDGAEPQSGEVCSGFCVAEFKVSRYYQSAQASRVSDSIAAQPFSASARLLRVQGTANGPPPPYVGARYVPSCSRAPLSQWCGQP